MLKLNKNWYIIFIFAEECDKYLTKIFDHRPDKLAVAEATFSLFTWHIIIVFFDCG